MTEEDIKLRFISPAIQKGWPVECIAMEARITNGRIRLAGNITARDKPLRADYLLFMSPSEPSKRESSNVWMNYCRCVKQ